MRPLVFADSGAARCSGMECAFKVIIEVELVKQCALTQSIMHSHMLTSILVSGFSSQNSLTETAEKVTERMYLFLPPIHPCKHSSKTVGPLQRFCLSVCQWPGFPPHTYTLSISHTHTQRCFCSMPR